MMLPENFDEIWSHCLFSVGDKVDRQHFKTWIEPIKPIELRDDILLIHVPSQFFFEYMPESDVNLFSMALRRLLGRDVKLEYRVMEDSSYDDDLLKSQFVISNVKEMWKEAQLNRDYTFETFMEGNSNTAARRAAKKIAENPEKNLLNPFFLSRRIDI